MSYTILRQIDRPNRYVFLEVWDTEPHYVTWQDSALTKNFIARTPLLGSPLDHRLNILCGESFDNTNGCILP